MFLNVLSDKIQSAQHKTDNLLRPAIPQLTWWDDVTKMLERNTALLCGIVLFLQTIKLITTVVMLSTAFLGEGVAGLIMLLMCPVHPLLKKIKKRAQKNRKVEEDLQEMERL